MAEHLVRVFEIPPPSGNYHFSGGEPISFVEVDWFRADSAFFANEMAIASVEAFIKKKDYFSPKKSYLVLHPVHSFTINYDPDQMIRDREQRE